jgi:hypothetical protein
VLATEVTAKRLELLSELVPRPSSSSRQTGMSGLDRTSRISLRETRLAPTLDAAALIHSIGKERETSSRVAAFERTINWVSVSFAILCSSCLRQHPLSPARPREGAMAGGVQEVGASAPRQLRTAMLDVPLKSSRFLQSLAREVLKSTSNGRIAPSPIRPLLPE